MTEDIRNVRQLKLMGVAEIGAYFDLKESRASELSRSPAFPEPLARLRCGGVWLRDDVVEFGRTWVRRPGRKQKEKET